MSSIWFRMSDDCMNISGLTLWIEACNHRQWWLGEWWMVVNGMFAFRNERMNQVNLLCSKVSVPNPSLFTILNPTTSFGGRNWIIQRVIPFDVPISNRIGFNVCRLWAVGPLCEGSFAFFLNRINNCWWTLIPPARDDALSPTCHAFQMETLQQFDWKIL